MRTKNLELHEAERCLETAVISVHVSAHAATTRAGQHAALTAIILATRCFGEVRVSGAVDTDLIVSNFPLGRTIRQVGLTIGAKFELIPTCRTVAVGGASEISSDLPCIQAVWDGWHARTIPGYATTPIGRSDIALAGITAAALSIGQAFSAEIGDATAGRRQQHINLWEPGFNSTTDTGPSSYVLPDALWLIGLGNLGQAYLWCLSSLAYQDRAAMKLYLQDFDRIGKENWGTSVLVEKGRYGMLKTKAAEEWAETVGFSVFRIDRLLDPNLHRTVHEPAIALAGLDKIAPRRILGNTGFEYVIDAGLGMGTRDFRQFRINVFDDTFNPETHFDGVEDRGRQEFERTLQLPAYQAHRAASKDGGCGTLILAQQPIVVPFVSMVAASVAVTQAIRIASMQAPARTVVGTLDDLRNLRVTPGAAQQRPTVGYLPSLRGAH
jgi:hypothetical protein